MYYLAKFHSLYFVEKALAPLGYVLSIIAKIPLIPKLYRYDIILIKLFEKGAVISIRSVLERFKNKNILIITLESNVDAYELIGISKENLLLVKDRSIIHFIFSYVVILSKLIFFKASTVANIDILKTLSLTFAKSISCDELLTIKSYSKEKHYLNHVETLFGFENTVLNREIKLKRKDKIKVLIYSNVFDSLPQRQWPIDNYRNLVTSLLGLESIENVTIVCTVDECNLERERFSELNVDFLISDSLKHFTKEVEKFDIFISSDCGPAHFASLTSTLLITIFGPEASSFFAPISKNSLTFNPVDISCSPCFIQENYCYSSCQDNICVKSIGPNSIITKIESVINENDS